MSSERWDRIEHLLSAACALPEDERASFLEEHCEDEAMRHEVTSLLENADEVADYFDRLSAVITPAREEIRSPVRAPGAYEEDPLHLKGKRVGRYLVQEHIGVGGMGVVYLAHDPELDRQVALKFLSPFFSTEEEAKDRFLKEARAVARLNHANICTIHDFCEQNGRPVLVMEYVEGETLRERLREGSLPLEEALEYATQIAEALAEAHEAGIIHRDIKPGNIMVTAEGRVKVMDFGLAKLAGADPITQSGNRVGTMAYMAPEQIEGREVDQRADLFAFGVMLFEMITGIRPFQEEHQAALMYSIIDEEPPSIYRLLPEAPEALEHIFDRTLAKEREERFDSAAELAKVLDVLRGADDLFGERRAPGVEKSVAGNGSTTNSISFPLLGHGEVSVRGKGLLIAAASIFTFMLFFLWWGFAGDERVETRATVDEELVAVFPFTVRGDRDLEDYGEGMVELFGRSLDGAGSLTTVDPNALISRIRQQSSTGVVGYDEAAATAASFGAGRFVLGSIHRIGDSIRINAYWYDAEGKALGSAQVAVGDGKIDTGIDELARTVISNLAGEGHGGRNRLAAQTTTSTAALKKYLTGQRAYRRHDFVLAHEYFEQAVEEDSSFALAHYRLSLAAGWIGEEDHIWHHAQRALSLSGELPEPDRRLIEARYAWAEHRVEEAERLYRLSVEDNPDDAEVWTLLGDVLFHGTGMLGRPVQEARDPFEVAMELDPTHDESLIHLTQLAIIDQDYDALDVLTSNLEERDLTLEWEAVYRAIRAILLYDDFDAALSGPLSDLDPAYIMRAAFLISSGPHLNEAEKMLRLLITPGRSEETRTSARTWLAEILAARGQLKAARQELDAVVELDSSAYLVARTRLATFPLPAGRENEEELLDLEDKLTEWDAETLEVRHHPWRYLLPVELYPPLRLYLLGLVRAAQEDAAGAEKMATQLKAVAVPRSAYVENGPANFSRGIYAEVERHADRQEYALGELESLEHVFQLSYRFYEAERERFLRAELLRELGRYEEAADWYQTLDGVSVGELLYMAPAQYRRAQVLEELDRYDEAVKAYERFLELWDDADPVLQPKLEDARDRLTRLDQANSTSSLVRSG